MDKHPRARRQPRPGGSARPFVCVDVVEVITGYLEGTLPSRDRARFEAHLEKGEGCGMYLDQMRQAIRLVGRVPEEAVPDAVREALLEAFKPSNQS